MRTFTRMTNPTSSRLAMFLGTAAAILCVSSSAFAESPTLYGSTSLGTNNELTINYEGCGFNGGDSDSDWDVVVYLSYSEYCSNSNAIGQFQLPVIPLGCGFRNGHYQYEISGSYSSCTAGSLYICAQDLNTGVWSNTVSLGSYSGCSG